jgi:hypothetical protein
MATDLYFDPAAALRPAEHAVAAPEHNQSFTEHAEVAPARARASAKS